MRPEELELWQAFESDPTDENRQALAVFYLPELRAIATKFRSRIPRKANIEIEDLISDAYPALLYSIGRFRRERGYKFITFASQRILGAMKDELRKFDWVPRAARLHSSLYGETLKRLHSLESSRAKGIAYMMPCPRPSDRLEENDFWKAATAGLRKTERLVILMYFRMGLRMKLIGKNLGLSESRVSQVVSHALARMRDNPDLKRRIA